MDISINHLHQKDPKKQPAYGSFLGKLSRRVTQPSIVATTYCAAIFATALINININTDTGISDTTPMTDGLTTIITIMIYFLTLFVSYIGIVNFIKDTEGSKLDSYYFSRNKIDEIMYGSELCSEINQLDGQDEILKDVQINPSIWLGSAGLSPFQAVKFIGKLRAKIGTDSTTYLLKRFACHDEGAHPPPAAIPPLPWITYGYMPDWALKALAFAHIIEERKPFAPFVTPPCSRTDPTGAINVIHNEIARSTIVTSTELDSIISKAKIFAIAAITLPLMAATVSIELAKKLYDSGFPYSIYIDAALLIALAVCSCIIIIYIALQEAPFPILFARPFFRASIHATICANLAYLTLSYVLFNAIGNSEKMLHTTFIVSTFISMFFVEALIVVGLAVAYSGIYNWRQARVFIISGLVILVTTCILHATPLDNSLTYFQMTLPPLMALVTLSIFLLKERGLSGLKFWGDSGNVRGAFLAFTAIIGCSLPFLIRSEFQALATAGATFTFASLWYGHMLARRASALSDQPLPHRSEDGEKHA